MVEDTQRGATNDVADDEKSQLLRVDGIYSNKFYIAHGTDGMIRLFFADEKEKGAKPNVKTEIILSGAGFMTLLNLMNGHYQKMSTPAQQQIPTQEKEKLN
jgi:hypothetical protein